MASYRYWRIRVTANQDGSIPTRIANIEFRQNTGGADATGSGTASTSGNATNPENAFDDNAATSWSTGTNFIGNLPNFVAYDFGVGQSLTIVEFTLQASDLSPATDPPKDFTIEGSNNNSSWTVVQTFTDELSWSSNETRTYSTGLAPAVATGVSSLAVNHVLAAFGVTELDVQHMLVQFGETALTLLHQPRVENVSVQLQISHLLANFGITSLDLVHQVVPVTGIAGIKITHRVQATGATSLDLLHQVVQPSGVASLTVRHEPVRSAVTSLSLSHRVSQSSPGKVWQLNVWLDGENITNKLTGNIRIDANKGAARIADFVMRPDAGAINTQAFVKKSVEIDYLTLTDGAQQTISRRFTGMVDDATFDPSTRLISFICTDNLQGSVEALDFEIIDDLVGGEWSPIVFSETDDGWEYAQQRMQSQAASFDKDVLGVARKWTWQAAIDADVTLNVNQIIDNSLTLTQNTSRTVVNEVTIEFAYRYPRLWQREIKAQWQYGRSFKEYLLSSSELPNREMFTAAIDRSWWIKSLSFTKLPPSGSYSTGQGRTNWIIREALRDQLIFGATAVLAKRWIQDWEETYTIKVGAPASIAQFGIAAATNKYNFQVRPDERYEDQQGTTVAVNEQGQFGTSSYQPPLPGSELSGVDYYLDDDDRPEFNQAIKTVIAIARTQILASHHQNEVTATTLLNPDLDIGKALAIDTPQISARGRVGALAEIYNIDDGVAHSTVSVNVFAPNVADQIDSAVVPPASAENSPQPVQADITLGTYLGGSDFAGNTTTEPPDPAWRGFLGNYAGPVAFNGERYPHEFRLETPPVEEVLRFQQTTSAEATYLVAIPQELLSITA